MLARFEASSHQEASKKDMAVLLYIMNISHGCTQACKFPAGEEEFPHPVKSLGPHRHHVESDIFAWSRWLISAGQMGCSKSRRHVRLTKGPFHRWLKLSRSSVGLHV